MISLLFGGYLIGVGIIFTWLSYENERETDQLKLHTLVILSLLWVPIVAIMIFSFFFGRFRQL